MLQEKLSETGAPARSEVREGAVYAWSPRRSSLTLSLAEQIAEHVGNAIIKGAYGAGARIPEQDVADQFNVSRGPVREALRILERDGLVQIHPRRGAQVAQLNAAEVKDLFEVRKALMGLAAKLLAERKDPVATARLRSGVERLAELASSDDVDGYTGVVYGQNSLLAEGSGNEFLRDMVFSLAHKTLRYSRLALATPERRARSVRLWREVAKAVEKGDGQAAQASVEALIRESRDNALKSLGQAQAE